MFQHSEADVKKIKAVQFGIISPEETKKMSVCHVETDRTFENGRPVPGGLQDLRLGTVDRDWKCTSCGMAQDECPGHFGHIELAAPMYHYSFLNNTLKTLRCVCYSCSAILGDEPVDDVKGPDGTQRKLAAAFKKKNPAHRLKAVMDIAKTQKVCWSCQQDQPGFKRDGLTIQAEFKSTDEAAGRKLEVEAEKAHTASSRSPTRTASSSASTPSGRAPTG
jgi:DNA-directed RNA polymerase II subunit RPB1